MQFTRFTDYALRVLIYLGVRQNEWVTIQQISDAYGVSRNHLMKVVSFLANQGFVDSQRGPGGGIRLAVDPPEINLAKVILHAEGDVTLMDCMRPGTDCLLSPESRLSNVLTEALQAFTDTLGSHSLADIIEPHDELANLLGIREPVGLHIA